MKPCLLERQNQCQSAAYRDRDSGASQKHKELFFAHNALQTADNMMTLIH
jgi:hypothetical protein